jgi:hypothetical protein
MEDAIVKRDHRSFERSANCASFMKMKVEGVDKTNDDTSIIEDEWPE